MGFESVYRRNTYICLGNGVVLEHPGVLYSLVLCGRGRDTYKKRLGIVIECLDTVLRDGSVGSRVSDAVKKVSIGRGNGGYFGYYDPSGEVFLDYRIFCSPREEVFGARMWLVLFHELGHALVESYGEEWEGVARRYTEQERKVAANHAAMKIAGPGLVKRLAGVAMTNPWRFYRGFDSPGFFLEDLILSIEDYGEGRDLAHWVLPSTPSTVEEIYRLVRRELGALPKTI